MLRVVLDTSCLVSYALARGEMMARVIAHWRAGSFLLLSSAATRAELAEVLARPAIQRLAVEPLGELARGLERFSHSVPGLLSVPGACRDPKDEKFLSCAIEGRAHYLVSSDRDLLDLRRFQGVAIINPSEFLLALELYSLDSAALAARFDQAVLVDLCGALPLEPDTAARVQEAIRLLRLPKS